MKEPLNTICIKSQLMDFIINWTKINNYTQCEAAFVLGISQSYFCCVKNKKYKIMSIERLIKMVRRASPDVQFELKIIGD